MNNYAFIDGQNLHIGTKVSGWFVDYKKFQIYLRDKYLVNKIFYFWGYYKKENQKIYEKLKKLDYVQIFKEHNIDSISNKKGNIDSNLIFEVMKKVVSKENFNKIILVSGDGDYKKMVNYLRQRNKFEKILFPSNKSASSLYEKFGSEMFDNLSEPCIKEKIQVV